MIEVTDAAVLVFAPIGRDAAATAEVLQQGGLRAMICADFVAMMAGIRAGCGAVFVAEEGLFGQDLAALSHWVEAQPPWSDLPFIILTSRREQPAVAAWRQRTVHALGNVALLERPVQTITLTSAVRTALRARARQYEVAALLEERVRAAARLEGLVEARTLELADTNGRLLKEIADKEEYEVALRQAQKIEAIGQLTGGVAHDFNNLLMVITGGLGLLDRPLSPERRQRIVEGMRNAAERGAGLSRQLLAFARRRPLSAEPVDIARQIGGMRDLLDRTLRGDVQVETRFAADLWPTLVDPAELELVLLNLCVNARDAMPEGGTITVSAENAPGLQTDTLHGDFVRIAVIDTGIGMVPDTIEKAFDPFFTTKEIGKGSGLGLPQVHGFAVQSGGAVTIESAVGHGTIITLLLPRSLDVPVAPPTHLVDLASGVKARGARGSMLLVEDDDEVAALVDEMLSQLGWKVTRVAGAAAALGALANGRDVDFVLSDVMMPGSMNGVDLAQEIRRRRPALPVVLTSGYAGAAARQAAEHKIPLLAKPYHLEDLDAVLTRTLQSTPAAVE